MAQQAQPFHSPFSHQHNTLKKQRSVPEWKPGSEKFSLWDTELTNWSLTTTFGYSYSNSMLWQSLAHDESSTGIADTRTSYTYNADGKIAITLLESFDGANWQNVSETTTLYSSEGIESGYETRIWTGNAWELQDGQRRLDSFVGSDVSTVIYETYDYTNTTWVSYMEYDFTYSAPGVIDEVTILYANTTPGILENQSLFRCVYLPSSVDPDSIYISSWNGSSWSETQRGVDLVWGTASSFILIDNEPINYVLQDYASGVWTNSERQTTTFDGSTEIVLTEVAAETGWADDYRTTSINDEFGNPTLDQGESFDGSTWVIDYKDSFANSYDAENRLTEIVAQQWNNGTLLMQNNYKREFLDFVDVAGLEAAKTSTFSIFPNPTNGAVQVRGMGNSFSYQLLDLSGRVVAHHAAVSSTISCEGIQLGMYVLLVQTGEKTATSTVVIQ
jgi:hypothetical protein